MFFDIHTHLLPGVDDGVDDASKTIEILSDYKKHGIDTIFFTPHVNHATVKTDINKIKEVYESFKEEFEKLSIKTYLGSEIYLKPKIDGFIPIKDKFLLVELPTDTYPIYLIDTIFELQLEGYEIILAHVERYKWLENNTLLIDRLKVMNVYFQVNIESLNKNNYYLKNSLIDFLAPDCHGNGYRSKIDYSVFEEYKEIFERGRKILKIWK